MNGSTMTHREKQMALSTLLRRDEKDPGAVDLLLRLMSDPDEIIRKRAVSIADRYAGHQRTLKALLQMAGTSPESQTIRKRALEQLEVLFDSQRKPDVKEDLPSNFLYALKQNVLRLVRSPEEPIRIRGKALELAAYFVSEHLLREWILFFHNRRGNDNKRSAIAAMGRTGAPRWRKYIQGYIQSENMEFTCAALEAIAECDYTPDQMLTDPPSSPSTEGTGGGRSRMT